MRYVTVVLMIVFLMGISTVGFAGDLDSPEVPDHADSAMFTLEDIYNRLHDGTAGSKRGVQFVEPGAGPTAGTGKTLDEVMGKAPVVDDTDGATAVEVTKDKKFWGLKSGGGWGLQTGTLEPGGGSWGVPKTGQTATYDDRDDGALQQGVAWPNPRFTDNNNGTVTDNLTGLIWLKNANCFGAKNWTTALADANGLADGACELTDGSSAGDWSLPNVLQLLSLIAWGYVNPALPDTAGTVKWTEGNPFSGVQSVYYWTGSTYAYYTSGAWVVTLNDGNVYFDGKAYMHYVWPVRSGQ